MHMGAPSSGNQPNDVQQQPLNRNIEQEVDGFISSIKQVVTREREHANAKCAELWNVDAGSSETRWTEADPDEKLDHKYNDRIRKACELLLHLRQMCSSSSTSPSDLASCEASKHRIESALRIFYYAQHAMYAEAQFVRAVHALVEGPIPPSTEEDNDGKEERSSPCLGISHFETLSDNPKSTTGFQKLLLYLMYQAYHRQYRKCEDNCYRRVFTHEGYNTHAWEKYCTIKEFIYDMTNKEFNFDMWSHLTRAKGNLDAAASYLATCRDPQFPFLEKRRDMFAFRNGIYLAREHRFVQYRGQERLPEHWVACKYFDLECDPETVPLSSGTPSKYEDWYDIPTPHMQQIMDCQEFPEEACRWLYAFVGRLIYPLNDLDQWQVIPFLQGQAGTGKSTILMNVCKNMFDSVDVGVLSNNIEKKFGLSAFVDKFVFIAPEVRNDLGLDQAEFQSMVSGEEMSIAKKNLIAEQVRWRVPGILAGNQIPNWSDSAGSIARRIIIWEFVRKPDITDTRLGERLAREMSAIIVKCNRAYHAAVATVAADNVSKHLPEYFKETDALLVEEVDSLRNFLNCGALKFGEDSYMPYRDFLRLYNSHCKEIGFRYEKLNKSSYTAPFAEHKAHVVNDYREWPKDSGHFTKLKWVVGMGEAQFDPCVLT